MKYVDYIGTNERNVRDCGEEKLAILGESARNALGRHRLGRRLGSPAGQGELDQFAEDHRVGYRRLPSRRPIA